MPDITGIGVAGILMMMMLDKLFAFLKTRNGGAHKPDDAGSQTVEFWKAAHKDSIDSAMAPHLATMTDVMRNLQTTETKIQEGVLELVILARQMSGKRAP